MPGKEEGGMKTGRPGKEEGGMKTGTPGKEEGGMKTGTPGKEEGGMKTGRPGKKDGAEGMPLQKKEEGIYLLSLLFMAVFSTAFVSAMGFLNYRSTAVTLEEQAISREEVEIVSGIEAALDFGKSFENYFGMEDVFEKFTGEYEGTLPFVIDRDGSLLYVMEKKEKDSGGDIQAEAEGSAADGGANDGAGKDGEAPVPNRKSAWETVGSFLDSDGFRRALPGLLDLKEAVVRSGSRNAVLTPIRQEGELVGFFGCLYDGGLFREGFKALFRRLLPQFLLATLLECLALLFLTRIMKGKDASSARQGRSMERVLSIVILAVGIFLISLSSIYTYQEDYRGRIETSVKRSLRNLEDRLSHVREQGVDLRDVEGLREYIRESVLSLNTLRAVRVSEHISSVERRGEQSDLISFAFGSGDGTGEMLYLEAEISDRAVEREMREIVLVLLSTTIILLIFVFELNNLVDLILACLPGRRGGERRFEKKVSLSLRLTGFLCSTAEYMCVPYAAMMIRASGESLPGLSLGVTAALPLTMEGLMQMAGMLTLPRFVKKKGVRPVLAVSTAVMILCNLTAFSLGSALAIVVCRALAGFAYAGFKQVSNYLITGGYDTEAGRSENISQDNAGLLAGATCGAGLGAILSANAGYGTTFLFSAILFAFYLAATLLFVPWKSMAERVSGNSGESRVRLRNVVRMIFSAEMFFYILVIGIPLNIGVMLCVTLIPAICQTRGISSVMLSYCYIANGLAGIYIGPSLVSGAKRRFGLQPCIAFAFALTAAGIFLLHLPPPALMIVIASMILGFLDGFGTPLVTDRFMELGVVKDAVDESSALIFAVVLSYILLTFAPMAAELLLLPGKGAFTPMMAGAAAYAAAAAVLAVFRRRGREDALSSGGK